jgi:hypothetical protein
MKLMGNPMKFALIVVQTGTFIPSPRMRSHQPMAGKK